MKGTRSPAMAGTMPACSRWAPRPLPRISLRARAVLEDAGGVRVTGYRAPSFSIDAAHALGASRCWPSRAIPILPASRRSCTITMAGARRRAFAFRPVAGADLVEMAGNDGRSFGRSAHCGGRRRLLPPAALYRFTLGDPAGQHRSTAGRPCSISIRGKSIRNSRASPVRAAALEGAPLYQPRGRWRASWTG